MKNIKTYIKESFKLGDNNFKSRNERYKYFPKGKNELIDILKSRIMEDPDADLNDIDVSQIVNMSNLFENIDPHNVDISEWDVSNVENMNSMFNGCVNFNCDLSKWNVKNVKFMNKVFYNCTSLKEIPSWYKSDKI